MVRSSLPFNSPLMTTDFPMFTISLSIRRFSGCGAADVTAGGFEATGAGLAGWPLVGFTASSRFHMSCPSALPWAFFLRNYHLRLGPTTTQYVNRHYRASHCRPHRVQCALGPLGGE